MGDVEVGVCVGRLVSVGVGVNGGGSSSLTAPLRQEAVLLGGFLQRCGILSYGEEGCRSAWFGTTI
jgi:hypothetical protein